MAVRKTTKKAAKPKPFSASNMDKKKVSKDLTPVMAFMQDDKTPEFSRDNDKFEDYPVTFTHPTTHSLLNGWIQDVEEKETEGYHIAKVVVLVQDSNGDGFPELYVITKKCVAPQGCEFINWDTVHCATEIGYLL